MAKFNVCDEISPIGATYRAHSWSGIKTGVAMIKLGRKGVPQLPVVSRKDASKLLGIITLHDIAEALSKEDDAVPLGQR